MQTVVSGIRATGQLHLGNYLGAVKNFVEMQQTHRCFFFVADYHSLTTHPDPVALRASVKSVVTDYLAAGINPEKAVLYIQSDVPQIPELYLLLAMHAYVGELERTASFKEKIRKQPENVNAGLLTYPILMAADILIHRAHFVPVGKDQEQHLEMTRNYAGRFNRIYTQELFPEPVAFNFSNELVKVPGLDGAGKMGKSEGEGNAVFLSEDPESIRKKVKRATTDSGPQEKGLAPSEPVANLLHIFDLVGQKPLADQYRAAYADMTIRYGDLKRDLGEVLVAYLEPIRNRIEELKANETMLDDILAEGAHRARQSANETMRLVRDAMGMTATQRGL